MTIYRILYRGSLSSCNYSCDYCPFAKTKNSPEELQRDRMELDSFVNWVGTSKRSLGVFFTPWGEAIVHRHYREALVRLSHMPHIERVALQTNLSSPLDDFDSANRKTLAFWATYHPTQVRLDRFIDRCEQLTAMDIRFSVGVVGLREHFDDLKILRQRLDPSTYVWINSYKREVDYYTGKDLQFLRSIDPYFDLNRHRYASVGKPCGAGSTSFTVDEHGDARRCHFVDTTIGNIYTDDIFSRLNPRLCPNATCGCHIGYVHRPDQHLNRLFGSNLLERIPERWPEVNDEFAETDAHIG